MAPPEEGSSLRRMRPLGRVRPRLRWALGALALLGVVGGSDGSGGAHAAEGSRERLLVGNNAGGTVTVISVPGFERLDTWSAIPDLEAGETGIGLLGRLLGLYAGIRYVDDLVASPDGERIYLSRSSVADVAAFDARTRELLWRTPVSGLRADHFALGPEGRRLYVSALTAGKVDVIDTADGELVGHVPTGDYPHGIGFGPEGRRLYVGSLDGDGITVADPESLERLETIPFERGVRPFVISPDGTKLYAQLSFLHGLVEYDLEAGRKTRTLHLPLSESARALDEDDYPNDAAHHGLAMKPDGSLLCAAATVSGYVALVALPELRPVARIPVGEEPSWAINSGDGRYCFVSSREADAVSVISYAEGREVARIPVGDYPQRMWTGRLSAPAAEAATGREGR